MTDDDKVLVERLRGDWPEILVEKHWMMDSDAIDKQREEAADRIEALSAENERLRERVERELAMTALANEDASSDWIDGFEHAWKRARAVLGGHEMSEEENEQPLVERLRWSDGWFFENPWDHVAYASDDPFEAADEIERLTKLLKMVWKREVPEIGTPDWHFLMSIVEPDAALGETK